MAVIDRVDAIVGLVQHADARSASAIIVAAAGLLGHVLRDISIVMALLDRLDQRFPGEHAEDRRRVLIAIGLLGGVVESHRALPRQAGTEDARAYVLSLLCATWRPDITLAHLSAIPRGASSAARREIGACVEALQAGRLFSVIDRE